MDGDELGRSLGRDVEVGVGVGVGDGVGVGVGDGVGVGVGDGVSKVERIVVVLESNIWSVD